MTRSLDEAIAEVVRAAILEVLKPYLERLAEPRPLVYSVPDAAKALQTSTRTVRRLLDEGVLPIVPDMGERILIPREAVEQHVKRAEPRTQKREGSAGNVVDFDAA